MFEWVVDIIGIVVDMICCFVCEMEMVVCE